MKYKAPLLALAVPAFMLAACNRAESPSAENSVTSPDTMAPAAGTGATGVDSSVLGEPGGVSSPGVVSEGGAGATAPMGTNTTSGMGTGTTYGADSANENRSTTMPNGTPGAMGSSGSNDASSNSNRSTTMPNGTPGTSTNGTSTNSDSTMPSGKPGNIQNAPADELGHPKRPAG